MHSNSPVAAKILQVLMIAMALDSLPNASSAPPETNYDESLAGSFVLPDVLAGPDEVPASSKAEWEQTSRPHQFERLEKYVYGRKLPPVPVAVVGVVERAEVDLGSTKGVRVQAKLRLGKAADAPTTSVLLYLPKTTEKVPVFLKLNFRGNQAETDDPGVWLPTGWVPADTRIKGIIDNRATDASRGSLQRRFPVASMLGRGYGMATAYCGDFFPDRPDGRPQSVLAALGRPVNGELPKDEPGAIGAWAWGLSRILDWLVTLPEVDPNKVIVVGHSRLGKTALWAGACDQRFAMVVSNDSGCGGAALSRRNFGETLTVITERFPHWFCPMLAEYAGRELELPCDQHALLAMAAPRPLYVASAEEDRWADPRGEFLAAVAAGRAWTLYGLTGLGTEAMPAINTPIGEMIGYHIRNGSHDLLPYDWTQYADFADRTLLGKKRPDAAEAAVEPDAHSKQLLAAFRPDQSSLPVPAPPNAVILVGSGVEPKFTSMAGGPINWEVEEGTLVATRTKSHANHIVSSVMFEDADIHAEFMISPLAHGNSGLYIHGHYEMQIYDSFGVENFTIQDEGSLYRFAKPLVNAARPAGEWQVYDIRFIAPKRNADGSLKSAGTLRAWLNGQLVQDGVTFTEPRSPYIPYKHGVTDYLRGVEQQLKATGKGPLFLQDHGSPTRFRNVWIRPLP